MAIYSLHHTPVGKSTQAQPYTAAAHIRYITRKNALSAIRQARFPARTPREVADYLRACEDRDRKNARVMDKVMLALPRELNEAQRIALVREFAEHVTKGRAPWLAAFHAKGKDARNPHCHLVIRDRDPATNKRVIGTSEIGSTERLRQQWEDYANKSLREAGRKERIDRRTLEAQGVSREPTIHEGPQSQAMDRRGAQPKSRSRRLRNRPGSRTPHRDVDYRKIDNGRSRPEVNRARQAGVRETERDYWDAIDTDNQRREIANLRGIHNPHRAEPPEKPRSVCPSFSTQKRAREITPRISEPKVVDMAGYRRKRDKDTIRHEAPSLGSGSSQAATKARVPQSQERDGPGTARKSFSQKQAAERQQQQRDRTPPVTPDSTEQKSPTFSQKKTTPNLPRTHGPERGGDQAREHMRQERKNDRERER